MVYEAPVCVPPVMCEAQLGAVYFPSSSSDLKWPFRAHCLLTALLWAEQGNAASKS